MFETKGIWMHACAFLEHHTILVILLATLFKPLCLIPFHIQLLITQQKKDIWRKITIYICPSLFVCIFFFNYFKNKYLAWIQIQAPWRRTGGFIGGSTETCNSPHCQGGAQLRWEIAWIQGPRRRWRYLARKKSEKSEKKKRKKKGG